MISEQSRDCTEAMITEQFRLASECDRLRAENERLREVLKCADEAINPPDRGGLSLEKWNVRLKEATKQIRAALSHSENSK